VEIPTSEVFGEAREDKDYQILIFRNNQCVCQTAWLSPQGVRSMREMIVNLDSSFQCRIKTRTITVTEAKFDI
jgi:hypothetical protein